VVFDFGLLDPLAPAVVPLVVLALVATVIWLVVVPLSPLASVTVRVIV